MKWKTARKPLSDTSASKTDNIDAVRDRLIEKGYEVGEKKLGADHAYQAWVTDPSGVRIEFHEYTDKSTQLTGENCILG